jgi:tetratricopeptide (TPR) repeat protein
MRMSAVRSLPSLTAILTLAIASLPAHAADIPGWDPRWPTPQTMLAGRDSGQVQQFLRWSDVLARNPNDQTALDNRGYLAMHFASKGLYGSYWRWLAAKDLERAVQRYPNDFYAWHNYGQLNYDSGDAWMMRDHSNAERAITAFTRAIAIKPDAARSYMGRGWAYLRKGEDRRAQADFDAALRIDPALRESLEQGVQIIRKGQAEEQAARGTLDRMGRYTVERSARTKEECDRYRGFWTNGECRLSQALNPGLR